MAKLGKSEHDEELSRLLHFQSEEHPAGRLIELDHSHGLVIQVRRGHVLATTVDQSGHETLCVLRGPGTVLGLESLIGVALPYFLWTLSDVELAIATAAAGREWLRGNGQPGQALLRAALEALRLCLVERIALHGSATERLSRLFLSATNGDGDKKRASTVMLGLPKNVLARMLQMRPETLSRVLRKLEGSGAIELGPELKVVDRDRLMDLLRERGD